MVSIDADFYSTKFSLMEFSCKYCRGSMVDCTQFIRSYRSNSSQLRRNSEFILATKSSICSEICGLSTCSSRDDLSVFCIDSILNICIVIIVFQYDPDLRSVGVQPISRPSNGEGTFRRTNLNVSSSQFSEHLNSVSNQFFDFS